jgi:cell division GTPase FtsZ
MNFLQERIRRKRTMLTTCIIGIGNCGNQIAALAKKELDVDVIAINTSEDDLATLPEEVREKSYVIGDKEGSGKNRSEAKKFLKDSITSIVADPTFKETLMGKDQIFIISSTGGGTGSGTAPIMSDIVRSAFRNPDGTEKPVILIGVLPKLSEGLSTQTNTKEYLHELFEVLENPTYMLYDNNNYSKETAYVVLQKVNQEVVSDIKVLECFYNSPTPFDSIDGKDMKMVNGTPGRIAVASLLDIKEKDLDEMTIEDALIDKLKKNAHAELQRDGIVTRSACITNLNDKLNGMFDSHISHIKEFVGEPVEEFLHIAVNENRDYPNNVSLVLAGLSPISDRVDKINDRIDEITREQEERERARRSTNLDNEAMEKVNEKRSVRNASDNETVNLKDTFAKFGI